MTKLSKKDLTKIRSEILSRIKVEDVLAALDVEISLERPSSDQYTTLCPFHLDDKPSLSIRKKDGVFHCHACHAKGSLFDFYGRFTYMTYIEVLNDLAKQAGLKPFDTRKPVPSKLVEKWHAQLLKEKGVRKFVRLTRGIDLDVMKEMKLGWDGERITIPVLDAQSRIRNVRRYMPRPPKGTPKVLSYARNGQGYGENRIYNISALEDKELILCEGEFDCLLLLSYGYNACTVTAGAGSFHADWVPWFTGKRVHIVFDNDKAGREGATRIANMLRKVAKVSIVSLPVEETEDVTDYFMTHMRSSEEFDALLASADILEDVVETEEPTKDPVKVELWEATKPEYVSERIHVTAQLTGKDESPYLVPQRVHFACDMTAGKMCDRCDMKVLFNGERDFEIASSNPALLGLVKCRANEQESTLKREANIPSTCRVVTIEVDDYVELEEVTVSPSIDVFTQFDVSTSHEYISRRAFIVGKHTITNQAYRFTGYTHPDPKSQEAVHVFDEMETAEDSISTFALTPDLANRLRIFQPAKRNLKSLTEKIQDIYDDFERTVHGLVDRLDMQIAMDLVWHSPLHFTWAGKSQMRGWLNALIIGDTGQAKSEMMKRLRKHYGVGDKIAGEQTTNAGLLGVVQKFGDRWILTWSRIPLNDKRLVVVEETQGIDPNILSQLSDVRESGIAEIAKAKSGKTYARTRLLFLANPRSRYNSISSFTTGAEAVLHLFKHPEDVRRLDFALVAAGQDVSAERLNLGTKVEGESFYTSELSRALVLWAWSRTEDQIQFTKEAQERILAASVEMAKKYSPRIPLVIASDQRLKLARMSAAIAARTFSSSSDGSKVVVKGFHVDFVVNFLYRTYDNPTMAYNEYSERMSSELPLEGEELEKAKNLIRELPRAHELCEQLEHFFSFRQPDLESSLGYDRDTARTVLYTLIKLRALRSAHMGYDKTERGKHLIRLLRKENFWPETSDSAGGIEIVEDA